MDAAWQSGVSDYVSALAWSPDGALLAVVGADGSVMVLAGATGEVVQRLEGHAGGALAAAFSRDGRFLATGGQDGRARLWAASTGTACVSLDAGGAWVEHVAWSPASATLATAAGRLLRRWSEDGALLMSHEGHESTVTGLAWLASSWSGREELAASCYGGVKVWGRRPTSPCAAMAGRARWSRWS